MILYLLKSLIFSALFLVAYHLLLEKEKMHRFNRIYLLFAILFSIVIPFVSIHSYSATLAPVTNRYHQIEEHISGVGVLSTPMKNTWSLFSILLTIYIGVSFFLFLRLVRILYGFYAIVRKNRIMPAANAQLVLLDRPVSPHTFLHYIFLSKENYDQQTIEPEIIAHETAHVEQKHSLDILLFEMLMVFSWINPLLFLYRKAIQLNHEYLADDAVIKLKEDISSYQYLLINKATVNSTSLLPSHFNFLTIKKRLTMMTKTTSRKKALFIQWAIAPAITALALCLCIETIAQGKVIQAEPYFQIKEFTVEGANSQQLKEVDDILNRHKSIGVYGIPNYNGIDMQEEKRLIEIYKIMSRKQQKESVLQVERWPKPLPKIVPTAKQLEEFTNPKDYGVWIDGKKVSNDELKKYKAADFSHLFISRLYGKARSSANYSFQVDLMTNKIWQKDKEWAIKMRNEYVLSFKWEGTIPQEAFHD
jgi:bla regulator protein BlaR1